MLKKLAGLGNLLQPGQFFLLFFPPMAYFNETEILRKLAGLGETLASLLQPGLFFDLSTYQIHHRLFHQWAESQQNQHSTSIVDCTFQRCI